MRKKKLLGQCETDKKNTKKRIPLENLFNLNTIVATKKSKQMQKGKDVETPRNRKVNVGAVSREVAAVTIKQEQPKSQLQNGVKSSDRVT